MSLHSPLSTILLVEDNASDEELTLRALKKSNIANCVVVARDGAAALDYLFGRGAHAGRDTTDLPQVVLLDLNLPKVSGFEVLRRVRASGKSSEIPVMIFTSSDSPSDRNESATLGARYFRKPPNYQEFLKIGPALRQFLEEQRLL